MWTTIFWIVVIVVVIGLVWYFLKQKKAPTPPSTPPSTPSEPPAV